jgi:CRISPR-associated exonuclease Cas4
MEENIPISWLNDFTFCPRSIFWHNLYGNFTDSTYKQIPQIKGLQAHKSIDQKNYSTSKDLIFSLEIYSEELNIIGKIDLLNLKTGELVERKRTIKKIYDGYLLQVWAQYFCLIEMNYKINKIFLHSLTDNKRYKINIPTNTEKYKIKKIINQMKNFSLEKKFSQDIKKCNNCIYSELCDINH